jgi:hypothetical protein
MSGDRALPDGAIVLTGVTHWTQWIPGRGFITHSGPA